MIQGTARNHSLDMLRSVGIIHVVLFHVLHGLVRFIPETGLSDFLARYPWWMNFTWQPFGVDVIFMISAYLLCLGLLKSQTQNGHLDLRGYFVRRVSRIIPLYYIAIIVFALAQQNSLNEVLLSAAFVQFLITGEAVVPVGWSMELMMLVYICLPAIIYALSRLRWPLVWVLGVIILSIAARYIPLATNPAAAKVLFTHLLEKDGVMPLANDLYFRPWYRLTPFLMGIGLAFMTVTRQDILAFLCKTPTRRGVLYGLAATLIYTTLFLPIHDATSWIYQVTTAPFWAIYWASNGAGFALAACLIIIAQHNAPSRWRGPWALISRNIMGIYLFHMPLILVGAIIAFRSTDAAILATATVWHVWVIFAVALVLSLGVAALLGRYVEQPIQRRLRQKMGV